MDYKKTISTVLGEVESVLYSIDSRDIEDMTEGILKSDKIFLAAAGRVMFVLHTFAKRLSQMGLDVHMIGGTTAPPVASGDLLIVASCSGKTVTPVAVAEKARQIGAKLWGITASEDSPLARLCDRILLIPSSQNSRDGSEIASVQPLNNLFEQVLHLLLDYISWAVQKTKGLSEHDIWEHHANIE